MKDLFRRRQIFSCYLQFLFSLLLLILPRFISPSDVAAPALHPATALWCSTRSAPIQSHRGGSAAVCAKALRTRGEEKGRATGFWRAYNIVFLWAIRWQAAFPGAGFRFSGAFTDANAVPWSPRGRQGGDTCPHQPANAKHVSSPPSAPPGENGRDLLHF